ncbi:hypothetical protein P9112_005455 [Eukaryota sp. TZLM1-RC]
MNVKIPSARKRMNDYLRNFLKVKEKAGGLAIPNNVFMKRFAAGIAPKGLAESLVSRINDQLLPDFKTLVKIATDGIVDHDRSTPGHINVNCPLRNGNAQTFDVKRSAHVHSIIEQVNTVLCAVSEADINNCIDSCLGDALNVYDSDSSERRAVSTCTQSINKDFPIIEEEE